MDSTILTPPAPPRPITGPFYPLAPRHCLPFGGDRANKVTAKWARKVNNRRVRRLLRRADTAIPDSGATGFYYAAGAPVIDISTDGAPVVVGTASGQRHQSTTTANHQIPDLPPLIIPEQATS